MLSMAELETVFNLVGITDNKTIKDIIGKWDKAGTGEVDFQDFIKYKYFVWHPCIFTFSLRIMEERDQDSQETREENDEKCIRQVFHLF